ncbi:YihY/virulence factor BrkB family protein [Rhodococcoides corynebacterioides]|uniref:YihY/virulence factor BrkB family protein n=1 Tax=Rhodococcoides corynebacterioides TaxID=53972 RepID=UPI001C9B3BC3|nr:YihY/virulence factor BrkB family protein [Rhodococcus corynebacterioides]MBY6349993.1 YihY/virulence factor BrkB family protein [Rhodococcus corynebacterioides]MBY6362079.1 YihY/virulence factor BrkB family protein [Rhodococcus corynebacterioides]
MSAPENPNPTDSPDAPTADARGPVPGRPLTTAWRVVARTASKAWDDSIFSESATAAFWQTLSLPPLILALLGSLTSVAAWFGPNTLDIIESKILTFSGTLFSDNVVDEIIGPTVQDILASGHGPVVSVGFLLSLWAGSSAISTFVDSIVAAHGQQDARNPVWQRIFALLLYVGFLIVAVFVLPLVALGPAMIGRVLPSSWYEIGSTVIDVAYYPGVGLLLIVGLTTLYKVALHTSLPWHRLLGGALLAGVFFMIASAVLRSYLSWVTGTGYTYGALATPIAFLLFTFFLGFAVVLGAEFNATVQEFWPARASRLEQVKDWVNTKAVEPATGALGRLATGPIRLGRQDGRGDDRPEATRGRSPRPDPAQSPLRKPS